MWTSGAKKGGSVSDCKACLASFAAPPIGIVSGLMFPKWCLSRWNLAGRLNIIDAFWLRNKFGFFLFFFPFSSFLQAC